MSSNKRKDVAETNSSSSDQKRSRIDLEHQQPSSYEKDPNGYFVSREMDPSCMKLVFKHDYATYHTLGIIRNNMKYLLEDVELSRPQQMQNSTLNAITTVYGKCFIERTEEIYSRDNFDLCAPVKLDNLYNTITKADALLTKLKKTGDIPTGPHYKDIHMRKAPATHMGFIDNPEDKRSLEKVIAMYAESPVWLSHQRTHVLDRYDIVDPKIKELRTKENGLEGLLASFTYELILLLQVLTYPYLYLTSTKWPSCEGVVQLEGVNDPNVVFNTHLLKLAFVTAHKCCKWYGGLEEKKPSEKKHYLENTCGSRKILTVLAELKEMRFTIGLLSGMIKPKLNVRNDCLRCMAISNLLRENDNIYKQRMTNVAPVLTNEEKKHFVTKSERQHLLDLKRYTTSSNALTNFLNERQKQLQSLKYAVNYDQSV